MISDVNESRHGVAHNALCWLFYSDIMKKDAYWFPHYCNARHDRKIKRLRKELGVEGYGIFFMLLETLRDQTDLKFPLGDTDLLAEEFGTSQQKVDVVLKTYGLFEIDEEEQFFSPKLLLYLQPWFEKTERARQAALKRWHGEDANAYANALPEQSDSNAITEHNRTVHNRTRQEVHSTRTKPDFVVNPPKSVEEVYGIADMKGVPRDSAEIYYSMRASDDWLRNTKSGYIPIANWHEDMFLMYRKGYLNNNNTKEARNDLPFG